MLSVVEAVAAAVVVVEVPMAQLGERFVVHAAPSWFSGFLSYLAEHAGLGVAAFGVGLGSETSEGLAEKSSIDDVAAVGADVVADGAHTREHSETALGGMAVEERKRREEEARVVRMVRESIEARLTKPARSYGCGEERGVRVGKSRLGVTLGDEAGF